MRSGVRQMRGDPRCADDEVAQFPPVVGERADDGSLPLDVGVDAALDAVDRGTGCDEIAQVAVRMLVAAHVVAAVERGKLVVSHAVNLAHAMSARAAQPAAGRLWEVEGAIGRSATS